MKYHEIIRRPGHQCANGDRTPPGRQPPHETVQLKTETRSLNQLQIMPQKGANRGLLPSGTVLLVLILVAAAWSVQNFSRELGRGSTEFQIRPHSSHLGNLDSRTSALSESKQDFDRKEVSDLRTPTSGDHLATIEPIGPGEWWNLTPQNGGGPSQLGTSM